MASKRGICKLNDSHRQKYPFLVEVEPSTVLCKKCNGKFSIASGGIADITRHINSQKHEKAMAAASTSTSIKSHFSSSVDTNTAAIEGVWAYHLIRANQSFKSSDCATKIFKTCFKVPKFSCSRTKCQAIVTNVFAPHAMQLLRKELEKRHYVSIYTDASNHGNIKLFPVLVRYFDPLIGVRVKILDITSQPGETSDIICKLLLDALDKNKLKEKLVCFCADNAKANFGGDTRGGKNNVFFKLKQHLPHLVGIGCIAHIEHNCIEICI